MDTQKRLLASFLVIASILVMTGFASASPMKIVHLNSVQVNGVEVLQSSNYLAYNVSVLSGNTIPVTVTFTAKANESNVRLSADLQGFTNDVNNEILVGDIEAGKTYTETVNLQVPTNMADVQSDNLNLVLTVWNGDSSVSETTQTITLRQQRQTYNVQVMSMNAPSSVKAGDLLPVDVVLKNTGYNQLNDLYVTLSIPALNIQRTAYFGDVATALGNDTSSGVIYLQVPYNTSAGVYTVQANVKNSDMTATSSTSVAVTNNFQNNVVAQSSSVNAGVGADATYSLTIVNPTSDIVLYKIVPENVSGVTITSDSVVAVPAGSSKVVTVTANAKSQGSYSFTVNAFSGNQLTGSTDLTLNAQGGVSNPVAILTIVLAVVFVVLLVVLIVLVTKKPKKQEEFGESYY